MAGANGWTAKDLPDQGGRSFLVTGGNSGIGFEAARALAGRGARVAIACRNATKAAEARDRIRAEIPSAEVETVALDLADLASVRKCAEEFRGPLHVLVNNAGVMAIPRRETADGFEMQLGTNHLGHFALTGLLLPRLLESPGARVVNVSSTAHKPGSIDFDDLQWTKRYRKWGAYARSKLANLLFTYELERRIEKAGASAISVACHPGYAATNLQAVGPRMSGSAWMERVMQFGNRLFSQSAEMGALPTVYAAAAEDVRGGEYFGPDRFAETWGHPKRVSSTARSHDADTAARLWDVSCELTGVRFEALES